MVSSRMKIATLATLVLALAVLIGGGYLGKGELPPYPRTVTGEGRILTDGEHILAGQAVYQKYALMDHGSIWGHGTLRGMDFSAQSLHLMGQVIRQTLALQEYGEEYSALTRERKLHIDQAAIAQVKINGYDPATGTLSLSPAQSAAMAAVRGYWEEFYAAGNRDYGVLPGSIPDPKDRKDLADFFFWTAWSAGTLRPGGQLTYTNNWPSDPSVGNFLPPDALLWSMLSIVALLVVLGIVIFVVHRFRYFHGEPRLFDLAEAVARTPITISQNKSAKFFLLVGLLFVLQLFVGGLMAHYTVHPGTFYLKAVAQWIPYTWAKTWHLQLGILWIAIAWMGTALFIAPLIGGKEVKRQGWLVDLLFGAVLLVGVGSLAGEVLGLKGMLPKLWFWLGHQGWEYLELGRIWQILLFVGLLGWLLIAYRAMAGALRKEKDRGGLLHLYVYSAITIVVFFGFGLLYGPRTHLAMADYWRWFVVHIWVEGMFEFFSAAAVALLLVVTGLIDRTSALKAAYLTAILVFLGGIIGTSHHYFWFGQTSLWLALGSIFSSLEPVPLILLVVRAWMEYKPMKDSTRPYPFKWPFLFITASSFWNFLGAGVFGFTINLPVINYYEHGTYMTSNHGHTALFGVYGMLALALLLFSWRSLVRETAWNERLLKLIFWSLNIGLGLMFLITLLPVGLMQVMTAYTDGFWLARNAAFYNRPIIQLLGNLRMLPDMIILLGGAIPLFLYLVASYLKLKPAKIRDDEPVEVGGRLDDVLVGKSG